MRRIIKVTQIGMSYTTHASQVFLSLFNHPEAFVFKGYPEWTEEQVLQWMTRMRWS